MIKKISYKDQVYQYLKTSIIKGEIGVGNVYSEQQIADQLEVSRTPVREAVLRLVNEGILEIYSNRGWGVRSVTAEDMQEIIQARIAIEGYCLRYLVQHQGDQIWQDAVMSLKACQAESDSLSQDDTHRYEYMRADTDFHCIIVNCVGNPYLTRLNEQMRTKIEQATFTSLNITHRSAKACTEHGEILQQVIDGTEESVMQAFMEHMESTAKTLGITLN